MKTKNTILNVRAKKAICLKKLNKIGNDISVFQLNLADACVFNKSGDFIGLAQCNLKRAYTWENDTNYKAMKKIYPDFDIRKIPMTISGISIKAWDGSSIFSDNEWNRE